MPGLSRAALIGLPLLFLGLVAAEQHMSRPAGAAAAVLQADRDVLLLGVGALAGALLASALLYAMLPRILRAPDAPVAGVPLGRTVLLALGAGLVAGFLLGPALFAAAGAWAAGVAAVAVLLALGALLAAVGALHHLAQGLPLRVGSHWGGIGGGGGGWELSAPAGLLLLALLLGAASLGALQALRPAAPAAVTTTTTSPSPPRATGN